MNQAPSDDSHFGLILIKPHGRKHDDDVRVRINGGGLEIIHQEEVTMTEAQAERHVANPEEQIRGMGNKVLTGLREELIDPIGLLGTDDPIKIGLMVKGWNKADLLSGPTLALVTKGENALVKGRIIMGPTNPQKAVHPEVRALSKDSPATATKQKRTLWTIGHATDPVHERFIFEMENLLSRFLHEILTPMMMQNTGQHMHV